MPEKKPTENKYGVNRSLSLSAVSKGKGEKAEHKIGSDRISGKDHKKIYHISRTEKKPVSFSDWQNKKGQEAAENSVKGENAPQEAKKTNHISKSEHTSNTVISENAAVTTNTEKTASAVPEQSAVSETKAISPEMAQRMKRAAFLEQKNNEAIRINRAAIVSEEAPEPPVSDSRRYYDEETADVPVEHNEEKQEQHTPHFTERDRTEEIQAYRVKQASKSFADKRSRASQEEAALKKAAEIAKGDFSSVGTDMLRNGLSEGANKAIDGISTVSGSVQNADSVQGAVMDLSSTLAAIEAKKMVRRLADTDLKKKKRAKERAKHNGNRFGIDKYDEVTGKETARKKAEKKSAEEPKGRIKAGNSHKMREENKAYAKKQRGKQIKSKRKEIFFKDNPGILKEVINGVPSGREIIKGVIKKKATSAILGGGIGAIALPILLAIVVFILLLAFFSWIIPFDYKLVGDDEDSPPHSAETTAEILDGYTLMIKNFMDTTQAYYYLNYGDWYGGTYSYMSGELTFEKFLEDYCRNIIAEISSYYDTKICYAESYEEVQELLEAKQEAIDEALASAREAAWEEYQGVVSLLDEYMTAKERRQPYEVYDGGGSNGIDDSEEFSGQPVEGTNFFGNKEIDSELAAEELLAYVALYKTLTQQLSGQEDEDSDNTLYISPDDINRFFKDTEFFSITATLTDDNTCGGANCRRKIVGNYDDGYEWEYYCTGRHQNLFGEIGPCKTADELLQKIIELTNPEEMGIDEDGCKKIIESTVEMIKKELDIDESGFRRFGAADNAKALEFYQQLIDGTLTNMGLWRVFTPIPYPVPEEETPEES